MREEEFKKELTYNRPPKKMFKSTANIQHIEEIKEDGSEEYEQVSQALQRNNRDDLSSSLSDYEDSEPSENEQNFNKEFEEFQVDGIYEGHTIEQWEDLFKITDFPILVEYFTDHYELPIIRPNDGDLTEHCALVMRGINIFRYNPSLIRILVFQAIIPEKCYTFMMESGHVVKIKKAKLDGLYRFFKDIQALNREYPEQECFRAPLNYDENLQSCAADHSRDVCSSDVSGQYNSLCETFYERLKGFIKDPDFAPGFANELTIAFPTTSVVEILTLLIIEYYDELLNPEYKLFGCHTHKRVYPNHTAVATVCTVMNEYVKKDDWHPLEGTPSKETNLSAGKTNFSTASPGSRTYLFMSKTLEGYYEKKDELAIQGEYEMLAEELKKKRQNEYDRL
ncbi:unnamed protein product [Moneuplotes crassus]|uniref:Uncharacterized protein n=1 Tax=Euplotes crassus TaxID=5936 RepID=A0AAD1XD73_EUPCR|nr:unnamed protein product [Moneuplotes crassus]